MYKYPILNPSTYISHHLTHFSSYHQVKLVDFFVINIDTVFWSILCGILSCLIMYIIVYSSTSEVPNKFQVSFEIIFDIISSQSKDIIKKNNHRFVISLALTIFIWISSMNLLDLLPVDLIPNLFLFFSGKYIHQRIVPTTDLNCTLGISLGVLVICLFYNFKIKGFKKFLHEILFLPLGIWLLPFNLILNIIEFVSKTISLGMRLFGNIYAGELLFLLIALLGSTSNIFACILQIFAGSFWIIFHILIIFLQAFIFMMLTLVYINQAHKLD